MNWPQQRWELSTAVQLYPRVPYLGYKLVPPTSGAEDGGRIAGVEAAQIKSSTHVVTFIHVWRPWSSVVRRV